MKVMLRMTEFIIKQFNLLVAFEYHHLRVISFQNYHFKSSAQFVQFILDFNQNSTISPQPHPIPGYFLTQNLSTKTIIVASSLKLYVIQ